MFKNFSLYFIVILVYISIMLVYTETFLFLVARYVWSLFLWESIALFFQTMKKQLFVFYKI